eukprot:g2352.t1
MQVNSRSEVAMSKSGVIKSIRNGDDGHDISLDNYNHTQATHLVTEAFSEPIPSAEPLKFTFIVGGGKKVRQKFSESLPKDMTQSLLSIGYKEDNGASKSMDCQGLFKYQEDLGLNLKKIIVFPHICPPATPEEGKDEEEEDDGLFFSVSGLPVATTPAVTIARLADQQKFE